MLACHASQREWLLAHHGMDEYIEAMRRLSSGRGKLIGVEFAGGYRWSPPNDDVRRMLQEADMLTV